MNIFWDYFSRVTKYDFISLNSELAPIWFAILAVIYAVDSTRPETLNELSEYIKILKKEDAQVSLISTKHDLVSEITDDEIKEFKQQQRIDNYYKTSSVTGKGVDDLFLDIAKKLISDS